MKIVTASNGKKTVKMSKKEWQAIGKKAGWTKAAEEDNITKIKNAIPSIVRRCNGMLEYNNKKYGRKIITPLSPEVAINNLTKGTNMEVHKTGGDPVRMGGEIYETIIPYGIEDVMKEKQSKKLYLFFNVYKEGRISYLDPFATQWLDINTHRNFEELAFNKI